MPQSWRRQRKSRIAAYVLEMRDSNLRKLEAENSIGLLAVLIAGFALSMMPAYEPVTDYDECRCALLSMTWMGRIIFASQFVHVLGLGLVGALASFSIIFTSGLYVTGTKILSTRNTTLEMKLAHFKKWFDGPQGTRRYLSRYTFALSLPIFIISIGVTPRTMCFDCVMGLLLFGLMTPLVCYVGNWESGQITKGHRD
eukprot:6840984-Prymnesium_polylepis.1